MQRLQDKEEQVPLLELFAQREPATFFSLPKDVQKYILKLCALQEMGRIAQVNSTLHALVNDESFQNFYEVRSNFSRLVPDINGVNQILIQPLWIDLIRVY